MLGNNQIMAENLKYFMEKYEKTRKQISVDLDVPYTTVCDWVNGKRYPRIDKIEALARYFHCSKADLVEERSKGYYLDSDAAALADFLKDKPEYKVLFDASRKVRHDDIEKIVKIIETLSD